MSNLLISRIICDGCGEAIERTSNTINNPPYRSAKREANRRHWVFNQRYGPVMHFCEKCADKAPLKAAQADEKKEV